MAERSEQGKYLNVRETARLLGVHENTVRNWVRAGTLRSAKVPGSSSHRFERAEVDRLERERGNANSSIAPLLRIDSPDLIGASDLDRWAGTADSKAAFPELIARLLIATPTVANVEMRSHEGVAAPGWDGSAKSMGSSVLPPGELRFELGTSAGVKAKADADYLKRVQGTGGEASHLVFVFVTPRNWAGGQAWASERAAEGHFADVRVLDAHTLTLWLHSTPSVHYWISERLGRSPRAIRTIAAWRSETLGTLRVSLPDAFFLAGRSSQAEILRERLNTQQPEVTTLQAGSRAEAIAFVAAVANEAPRLADRIVVVKTPNAWNRIIESTEPLVTIPDFDDADTRAALARGHSVVLAAGVSERIASPQIELPKIDPHAAAESLRLINRDRSDENRLVALARRSFPALLRSESPDVRIREPEWLREPDSASILARLALVGVWTRHAEDRALCAELTGASEADIELHLTRLETRDDAPFIRSGGLWRMTSPNEMGLLLFPRLGESDKARWRQALKQVMLEPDPFAGMDSATRLASQFRGTKRRYSEVLKTSLAEQLALLAGLASIPSPNLPTDSWPQDAVFDLLSSAEEDSTGRTWCDLAPVLPLLAEAAPEVFLDVVGEDLERPAPTLRLLFQDSESDFFGASSPHSNLLWALEGLCWNRELFDRATSALVGLAAIDPGGRLSNRPFESLKSVSLGWIRHSGAHAREKLSLIESLLAASSPLGWQLLLAVWPSNHQTAFTPRAPLHRDWEPGEKSISWREWGEFVDGLTDLALGHAGSDPRRWVDLVHSAPSMPPLHRNRIRVALAQQSPERWTSDVRFEIWKQLVDEIGRHEEFPDAEWSMPESELREWRGLADDIGPGDDPRRHSILFTWRPRLTGMHHDDPSYPAAVRRKQIAALEEIATRGDEALRTFTRSVKDARAVGAAIAAQTDPLDRQVLAWLATDEEPLLLAAMAIARIRAEAGGVPWVLDCLTWPEMRSSQAQERLVRAIPANSANWPHVSLLGEDLEAVYWRDLNPYAIGADDRQSVVQILMEKNNPWAAMTVLANQAHAGEDLDNEVVKMVLQRAAADASPIPDRTMASHYVERLLEHLETTAMDDPVVAALEFTYFRFLHDHRPVAALYRALNRDPQEFVELVCSVFRAEGEGPREQSPAESRRASIAYDVLHHWPTLPGQDTAGEIDGDHLSEWVATARAELARRGRGSIGDEVIGGVLSASPTDADGIWPTTEVRAVIESANNARLETGLQIGVRNRRGVTSRGVFEGGDQERSLESQYRTMATKASRFWPRTARLLRGLADSYLAEAREHDAEAERLGDHG